MFSRLVVTSTTLVHISLGRLFYSACYLLRVGRFYQNLYARTCPSVNMLSCCLSNRIISFGFVHHELQIYNLFVDLCNYFDLNTYYNISIFNMLTCSHLSIF